MDYILLGITGFSVGVAVGWFGMLYYIFKR